jgi:hypothetical protein
MIRTKIVIGFALAASLVSLAPVADAAPVAAPRAAVTLSSTDGQVMKDVTRVVVVVRRAAVVRRPVARRRVVR